MIFSRWYCYILLSKKFKGHIHFSVEGDHAKRWQPNSLRYTHTHTHAYMYSFKYLSRNKTYMIYIYICIYVYKDIYSYMYRFNYQFSHTLVNHTNQVIKHLWRTVAVKVTRLRYTLPGFMSCIVFLFATWPCALLFDFFFHLHNRMGKLTIVISLIDQV